MADKNIQGLLRDEATNALVVVGPNGAAVGGGAAVNFTDDFSTNKVASYTFNAGQADFTVAGGVLDPGLNKTIRAYPTGYTPADVEILAKITTGASVAGTVLGFDAKDQDMDESDCISAVVTSAERTIYSIKNTVGATLTGGAFTGIVAATTKWYRLAFHGNVIAFERFAVLPDYKSDPEDRVTVTLAGNDAARFGAMVKGPVGFRFSPGTVNAATLDDLIMRGVDL